MKARRRQNYKHIQHTAINIAKHSRKGKQRTEKMKKVLSFHRVGNSQLSLHRINKFMVVSTRAVSLNSKLYAFELSYTDPVRKRFEGGQLVFECFIRRRLGGE